MAENVGNSFVRVLLKTYLSTVYALFFHTAVHYIVLLILLCIHEEKPQLLIVNTRLHFWEQLRLLLYYSTVVLPAVLLGTPQYIRTWYALLIVASAKCRVLWGR